MDNLITPQEVIRLAFPANPSINASSVSEQAILTAQEKFLRPVLNGLYKRLEEGDHPEFLSTYIKPALALYVKLLLLPVIASSVGQTGIVRYKSDNFSPASGSDLAVLERRTRADALTLMRKATEYIERNPEKYPDYKSEDNVLNRISLDGGVVL